MADKFDPMNAKRLKDPSRLEALPRQAVVDLLQLQGAETVVDYGAGTGIYTVAVAAALPDGKVFAVEALPRLVELLRQKITPQLADRICLCETDDNVVSIDDGEADRVVMVDVLHHLHDQPEALEEVVRVLRPAGCSWWSTGATPNVRSARRPATCSVWTPCAGSSPGWASKWSRRTPPATCSRITWW